ncbi:hypothetical protein WG66_013330 [Moniliophthora roreri]|nr:hypothetical protein WG66_013330 [Moniliophthora roreri]
MVFRKEALQTSSAHAKFWFDGEMSSLFEMKAKLVRRAIDETVRISSSQHPPSSSKRCSAVTSNNCT